MTRKDAPELFALIDEVRSAIGAPEFHHVLIDGDFNASVTQIPRLSVFGWFSNFLTIGLPLLKTMTPDQFKSVVAHEYGHLAGGYGKLSNWVYRQRRRWSHLLQALDQPERKFFVLAFGVRKHRRLVATSGSIGEGGFALRLQLSWRDQHCRARRCQ